MTAEELAILIRRHCPEVDARTVEYLDEGDFSRGFAVDDAWVFRVAKHAEAAAALRREACFLPTLADHLPLPIPRPRFALGGDGAAPMVLGHPMLPGPALSLEAYLDLPEPARDRCARQVAGFLVAMHRFDLDRTRACGIPTADYRERFASVLDGARTELFGMMGEPERAYVERTLREYLDSGAAQAFQPVLLHGDLSPEHVLYDPRAGAVTGIIDFGDLEIGDPAWDLVYLYEDYGLDFLGRFLEHFPVDDRERFLWRTARFQERGDIAWALHCARTGSDELDEALERISELAAQADAPPWRALL